MGSKVASLLTNTQRSRISNNFDSLDEEKKRRDQQRIRDRINAGSKDFQQLVDYPDRQISLAFKDMPEDELQRSLADMQIFVSRLCEIHDIDQEELTIESRDRSRNLADPSGPRSLETIEFHTDREIEDKAIEGIKNRMGNGPWDRRADRLAKLGASAFLPLVVIGVLDWYTSGNLLNRFSFVGGLLVILLSISLIGWLLIVTAQALKYDIMPFLHAIFTEPDATIRKITERLIKNPKKSIYDAWDDL